MPAQLYRLPTVPEQLVTELNNKRKEFIEDMDKEDSILRRTLNANGVFRPDDMKFNDAFYRFSRNDPYNYIDGAREYLFFTKPDLPLVNQSEAQNAEGFLTSPALDIPYFRDLAESPGYRKSVFCNLSYSGTKRKDGCPFIRILSNRKTSNMDIPDITVEELETAVNMYGSKLLYPKSSQSNDEDLDFTIEFEDTRFLEIFHLFKVWDYYRSLRWYGVISPASFLKEYGKNKTQRGFIGTAANAVARDIMEPDHYSSYTDVEKDYIGYIFHKVLHDHIRIFKFLIDNDGETILYAASAIGCFPKTIQRSAFSEIPERGPLKISVGFKLSGWFEDDITSTIQDFNAIVNSWVPLSECVNNYYSIYDYEIGAVSQELVDVPFIIKANPESKEGSGRNSEFCRYIFGWAKLKQSGTRQNTTNKPATAAQQEPKKESKSEALTNIKAPNGKYVTQNDYDYLKDYDENTKLAILFANPKYAAVEEQSKPEESTKTEERKTTTTIKDNKTSTVQTWNGAPVISQTTVNTGYGSAIQVVKSQIDGRILQIPLGYEYRATQSTVGNFEYLVNRKGELFNLDGSPLNSN